MIARLIALISRSTALISRSLKNFFEDK